MQPVRPHLEAETAGRPAPDLVPELQFAVLGQASPKMSGKLVTEVYRRDMTDGQQKILLNLASHADTDTRIGFPGIRLIAIEAKCSERYVRQMVSELEALGAITTEHRQGGRGHRTRYTLHLDQLPLKPELSDIKGEPQFRVASTERGNSETQRGNSETTKGELSNTDLLIGTVREPSIEPSYNAEHPPPVVRAPATDGSSSQGHLIEQEKEQEIDISPKHGWVNVFLTEPRFSEPDPSWVDLIEAEYPSTNLVLAAHSCLEWLQTNTKGKRYKGFKKTFHTWLRNMNTQTNGYNPNGWQRGTRVEATLSREEMRKDYW